MRCSPIPQARERASRLVPRKPSSCATSSLLATLCRRAVFSGSSRKGRVLLESELDVARQAVPQSLAHLQLQLDAFRDYSSGGQCSREHTSHRSSPPTRGFSLPFPILGAGLHDSDEKCPRSAQVCSIARTSSVGCVRTRAGRATRGSPNSAESTALSPFQGRGHPGRHRAVRKSAWRALQDYVHLMLVGGICTTTSVN